MGEIFERLKKTLREAQEQRRYKADWVLYERQTMLMETNSIRQKLGLPPITEDEVLRCENLALGHSDYYHKFALYCSFLAEDRPDLIKG